MRQRQTIANGYLSRAYWAILEHLIREPDSHNREIADDFSKATETLKGQKGRIYAMLQKFSNLSLHNTSTLVQAAIDLGITFENSFGLRYTASYFEDASNSEKLANIEKAKQVFEDSTGTIIEATEFFLEKGQLRSRALGMKRIHPNADIKPTSFADEYLMLTRLKHPNIPPMEDNLHRQYEFGWYPKNRLIYTFGLPHGTKDIFSACQSTPNDNELKIQLLLQLFGVLAYLRWKDIVHGDLRSENLRIADGKLWLVGLGVDHRTSPVINEYSAPEVRNGQLQWPDRQSDLWSAGAIAYHLLTGYLWRPDTTILPISHLKSAQSQLIQLVVDNLLQDDPNERKPIGVKHLQEMALDEVTSESLAPNLWLDTVPLVGRDDAHKHMNKLLDSLIAGQSGFLLLHGSGGIGKSTLLNEIGWRASTYENVIVSKSVAAAPSGKGGIGTGAYTLWRKPLIDLLRTIGRQASIPTRELLRLIMNISENSTLETDNVTTLGGDIGNVIKSLYEEAKKTFKGKKKFLILLDELQWSVNETFEVIKILTNSGLPIAIIATFRTDAPNRNRELEDVKIDLGLKTQQWLDLQDLNQLSISSLYQQVSDLIPHVDEDNFASSIWGMTDRIPYIILECIRYCIVNYESVENATFNDILKDGYYTILERSITDQHTQKFLASCAELAPNLQIDLSSIRQIYADSGELIAKTAQAYILEERSNEIIAFKHQLARETVLSLWRPADPVALQTFYSELAHAVEVSHPKEVQFAGLKAELWKKAGNLDKTASNYLDAAIWEYRKSAYAAAKSQLESLKQYQAALNEETLSVYNTYAPLIEMGLGLVNESSDAATQLLEKLGEKIPRGKIRLGMALIREALKQFGTRLIRDDLEWLLNRGNNVDNLSAKSLLKVKGYRYLMHSEYFKNNAIRLAYCVLRGTNICDQLGMTARGRRADMFALGALALGIAGFGNSWLVSVYQVMARQELVYCDDADIQGWVGQGFAVYHIGAGAFHEARKALNYTMRVARNSQNYRRVEEALALRYLLRRYSGDWEAAKRAREGLDEIIPGNGKTSNYSPQAEAWLVTFKGEEALYEGKYDDAAKYFEEAYEGRNANDEAAWLLTIGGLARTYLRQEKIDNAESICNEFLKMLSDKPLIVSFYAKDAFFSAFDVYFERLTRASDSDTQEKYKGKIQQILMNLIDLPKFAFAKRFHIAMPQAWLCKSRFMLFISGKNTEKTLKFAEKALSWAKALEMLYDEALVRLFIASRSEFELTEKVRNEHFERASAIFSDLNAIWELKQVAKFKSSS